MRSYRKQLTVDFYALGFVYDPTRACVLVDANASKATVSQRPVVFGGRGGRGERPVDHLISDVRRQLGVVPPLAQIALAKVSPKLDVNRYSFVMFLGRDEVTPEASRSDRYAWVPLASLDGLGGMSVDIADVRQHLDALYAATLRRSAESN